MSFFKKLLNLFTKFYIPTCIKNHTFFLKKIKDGSLIIDLGMNKGEFSKTICNFKKNLYITGVELNTDLMSGLNKFNNFYIKNLVIAGHSGKIKFYEVEHSTRKEYFGKIYTIILDEKWKIKKEFETKCISLNEFISESMKVAKIDKVDLIKLDIEGAEINALNSLDEDTLNKIKQITLEFHGFMFASQTQQVTKLTKKLKEYFYIFDFSLSEPLRDCLFINKSYLNFFEYLLYTFLTSKFFKALVNKRTGIFRVFLHLYRNYQNS